MPTIINNNEPMPLVPHGAKGYWEWDGHATTRTINASGEIWLRGKWNWIQAQAEEQKPLANATVSQIVEWHRPKMVIKPNNTHAVDYVLCKVAIASAIVIGLSVFAIVLI
tara:strand:- start:49 stop:378 length:330 start_codon:yes stop_codon:yes gene_type:complete